MLELELATTEQILDELARRPLQFVFVTIYPCGKNQVGGYLAHSPQMDSDEARQMLLRAEQLLTEPSDEQSFDDGVL